MFGSDYGKQLTKMDYEGAPKSQNYLDSLFKRTSEIASS